MKRITSLILALVMTAALLAGCGGDSSTADTGSTGDAGAAEDGGYTANWIVAVNTSEGDLLYEATNKFCELVEEYSDGRAVLQRETVGKPVLLVTHDEDDAAGLDARIIRLAPAR